MAADRDQDGRAGRSDRRLRRPVASREQGAGALSTSLGLAVVLALLLLTVHVLLRLHAATIVSTAALDGARQVASARARGEADAPARARAEAEVRRQLGAAGATATLDWSASTDDQVALRVVVDVPDVLPEDLAPSLALDVVDRTAAVRVEDLR